MSRLNEVWSKEARVARQTLFLEPYAEPYCLSTARFCNRKWPPRLSRLRRHIILVNNSPVSSLHVCHSILKVIIMLFCSQSGGREVRLCERIYPRLQNFECLSGRRMALLLPLLAYMQSPKRPSLTSSQAVHAVRTKAVVNMWLGSQSHFSPLPDSRHSSANPKRDCVYQNFTTPTLFVVDLRFLSPRFSNCNRSS